VPPTSSVVNSNEDGAPARIADAVVSGTVEVSGLPAPWPETVTFIMGNDHNATIVKWLAIDR
jgi:hypothetical protein